MPTTKPLEAMMNIGFFPVVNRCTSCPIIILLVAPGWSLGDQNPEYFITSTYHSLSVWLADQTQQGIVKSCAILQSRTPVRGKNQTPQLSYQRDFVVLAVHVLMMPCILEFRAEMPSILLCQLLARMMDQITSIYPFPLFLMPHLCTVLNFTECFHIFS